MIRAQLAGEAYQVEITAGAHRLVADEKTEHGGKDAGPTPFDLVAAGLAACTLITLRMYAERKGQGDVKIAADLFHHVEDGRNLIDRRIRVSGASEEVLERMRDIVERTPVTLALKNGFAISTSLQEVEAPSP